MRFKHPTSGWEEKISNHCWLWALLFGPFYFAYMRMWMYLCIYLVLAAATGGVSTFIYPFFAKKSVMRHYMRRLGWVMVSEDEGR